MDAWLGNRKRILVLNREDMISTADRNAWATYYANQGTKVVFSNGKLGMVCSEYFFQFCYCGIPTHLIPKGKYPSII